MKKVYYSGTDSNNELVEKYFPKGIGSILAFEFEGTEDQVFKLLNSVKVFTYLPNVGDVRSLIVNPGRITHREIPGEIKEKHNPELSNQVQQSWRYLRMSFNCVEKFSC